MYHDLNVRTDGPVGWITLDRAAKHNSLREQTFAELSAALRQMEADPGVKVVILTGSGDRAFCAGIDMDADGLPADSPAWDAHTKNNAEVVRQAWYLDKPLITAVNGFALAGGCNLALIGDLTLASDRASFGEPEIRHGALSPLLLLPWLTNFKNYSYLYLTGDRVDAHEAKAMGLVNRVVPHDDLAAEAAALAARVAAAPGFALTLAKRAVRLTLDSMGFHTAQGAHRYVDTFLLDSRGVTEKERLMEILGTDGMRAFLDARDRPYGER